MERITITIRPVENGFMVETTMGEVTFCRNNIEAAKEGKAFFDYWSEQYPTRAIKIDDGRKRLIAISGDWK